jgi:hypothetical protein
MWQGYITDKELIIRIYREFKKLNSQRRNNPLKKWANELNRYFSKKEVQMANEYMKKCSASLAIKDIQIKNCGRVNSSMIYLIYCKNNYKYHNVPPHPAQQ